MNDKIIDHICPVCNKPYQGEEWKTKCYYCYKHYRYAKRINVFDKLKNQIYYSHPSVTEEEMNTWIDKHKSYAKGWGVKEATQTAPGIFNNAFKIWIDNTNFD